MLFCFLSLSDMVKIITALHYSYNMLKSEIDVTKEVNILSFEVFCDAIHGISSRTSVILTALLSVHRVISIKWPTKRLSRLPFFGSLIIVEIYYILLYILNYSIGHNIYYWNGNRQSAFVNQGSHMKIVQWMRADCLRILC